MTLPHLPIGSLLLALALGGPQLVSTLPKDLSRRGLVDLTSSGEIIHLPAHDAAAFRITVATRADRRCSEVERTLVDVERYPEVWPDIAEVRVVERTARDIRYELDIALAFSPTVEGHMELPNKGIVLFHAPDTGGKVWYELRDTGAGCQLMYNVQHPPGRRAGFVEALTSLEKRVADAAEIGAALATVRGLARPEQGRAKHDATSVEAQRTWDRLATTGTVLRTMRRPGKQVALVGKRTVAVDARAVLASIRDRRGYPNKIDNIKKVTPKNGGSGFAWELRYLGGRVSSETAVEERGDVTSAAGLTITERVVGGDTQGGEWRWTIRAVEGGSEVELFMDYDLASGSAVLTGLARQHEAIESALPMLLFLQMLGQLVPGPALAAGDAVVARVP